MHSKHNLDPGKTGSSRRCSDADFFDNPAEWLLAVARLARFLADHGTELPQIPEQLGVPRPIHGIAMAFIGAPIELRFRALVEDWKLQRIQSALQRLPVAKPELFVFGTSD